MGDQLVEFLRSKKERVPHSEVDWQARRDAWVRAVRHLYTTVRGILKDSIEAGHVELNETDMQITEEFAGAYAVPWLELRVGNERVEFRPMGIAVLGAAGRVDIRGECGVISLLNGQDQSWTMILERIPRLETAPLNPETLRYALERVMFPLQ